MEKVLFVLIALLCQDSLGQLCGCPPGEIWNDCASCDPEATCQNRIPEAPGICPAVCQQRCECDSKNGLIRDQISGQCVLIEKCPGCSPGEIWNECASCNPDPTCQNSTVQIPKICADICYPRCECDVKAGFIRDEISGQCIPREKCSGMCWCGPLEVFNECASPCIPERTCQHQFPVGPDRCILPCEQRCECDKNKGLIRDEESGNCIDIGKCEDRCGRNQFFGCRPCCPESTCDNPKPISCIRPCPLLCINECLCKEGYVRNTSNGQCVLPRECPRCLQ
ncbi:zonadhesin-like isoform X2 [Diabrotica undecimpunctata]|uniref:zonadhesin-like isoform X2 n=1 Tax=Diabrotica undecimpunctata TaxID=50387 RepID=UPI003B63205A